MSSIVSTPRGTGQPQCEYKMIRTALLRASQNLPGGLGSLAHNVKNIGAAVASSASELKNDLADQLGRAKKETDADLDRTLKNIKKKAAPETEEMASTIRNASHNVSSSIHDAKSKVGDVASKVGQTISGVSHSIGETAQKAAHKISDAYHEKVDQVTDKAMSRLNGKGIDEDTGPISYDPDYTKPVQNTTPRGTPHNPYDGSGSKRSFGSSYNKKTSFLADNSSNSMNDYKVQGNRQGNNLEMQMRDEKASKFARMQDIDEMGLKRGKEVKESDWNPTNFTTSSTPEHIGIYKGGSALNRNSSRFNSANSSGKNKISSSDYSSIPDDASKFGSTSGHEQSESYETARMKRHSPLLRMSEGPTLGSSSALKNEDIWNVADYNLWSRRFFSTRSFFNRQKYDDAKFNGISSSLNYEFPNDSIAGKAAVSSSTPKKVGLSRAADFINRQAQNFQRVYGPSGNDSFTTGPVHPMGSAYGAWDNADHLNSFSSNQPTDFTKHGIRKNTKRTVFDSIVPPLSGDLPSNVNPHSAFENRRTMATYTNAAGTPRNDHDEIGSVRKGSSSIEDLSDEHLGPGGFSESYWDGQGLDKVSKTRFKKEDDNSAFKRPAEPFRDSSSPSNSFEFKPSNPTKRAFDSNSTFNGMMNQEHLSNAGLSEKLGTSPPTQDRQLQEDLDGMYEKPNELNPRDFDKNQVSFGYETGPNWSSTCWSNVSYVKPKGAKQSIKKIHDVSGTNVSNELPSAASTVNSSLPEKDSDAAQTVCGHVETSERPASATFKNNNNNAFNVNNPSNTKANCSTYFDQRRSFATSSTEERNSKDATDSQHPYMRQEHIKPYSHKAATFSGGNIAEAAQSGAYEGDGGSFQPSNRSNEDLKRMNKQTNEMHEDFKSELSDYSNKQDKDAQSWSGEANEDLRSKSDYTKQELKDGQHWSTASAFHPPPSSNTMSQTSPAGKKSIFNTMKEKLSTSGDEYIPTGSIGKPALKDSLPDSAEVRSRMVNHSFPELSGQPKFDPTENQEKR